MVAASRRQLLCNAVVLGASGGRATAVEAAANGIGRDISPFSKSEPTLASEWMSRWMTAHKRDKDVAGPLRMSRFADPMCFLLSPIVWKPGSAQPASYPTVTVPTGFVTDLASIPRLFWSLLRPDGRYAYAAIVHDYLYWSQDTSKPIADDILKLGMQDLGVDKASVLTIYEAVYHFGSSAWRGNARLRQSGEKRVLTRFPEDPRITWSEWKRDPSVFRTDR